jgi:hypothetical protein
MIKKRPLRNKEFILTVSLNDETLAIVKQLKTDHINLSSLFRQLLKEHITKPVASDEV